MKFDLDMKLLQLSANDVLSARAACEEVSAMGGVGSGKSSGLAKTLANAYLKAGFGGSYWSPKTPGSSSGPSMRGAPAALRRLIIFDEKQGYNFMAHEMLRQGGAGIGSVVAAIDNLESADRATGAGGKEERTILGPRHDDASPGRPCRCSTRGTGPPVSASARSSPS